MLLRHLLGGSRRCFEIDRVGSVEISEGCFDSLYKTFALCLMRVGERLAGDVDGS